MAHVTALLHRACQFTENVNLTLIFQRMSTENPYQEITVASSKLNQPFYSELAEKSPNQSNASASDNVAIRDLHIQGLLRSGSFATICQGTFQGQACVVKRPGKGFWFIHYAI